MVGPGTGVAPFRAFVQERRATAAKGRNWLFFGDRNFTHDFLYQLEWQDALKDGALTRMDVAFSRDTPRKGLRAAPHVGQAPRADRMARGRRASSTSAATPRAMAKDVRATLARAYADVKALSAEAAEQARRRRSSARSAICRIPIDSRKAARTHDRRRFAQRAHQGSERLSARHDCRGPARGNHRGDRRRRSAAGQISWHVSAGRPRPARRAHAQEDGEGLHLHDARARAGRRADACSSGWRSTRSRATYGNRHACG